MDIGPRAQRRLTSPSRTLSPSAANNGAARRSSRGERRRRVGPLGVERVGDMLLHLCNCAADSLSIRRKAAEWRETLGTSSLDWLRATDPQRVLPIEQCARAPAVKSQQGDVQFLMTRRLALLNTTNAARCCLADHGISCGNSLVARHARLRLAIPGCRSLDSLRSLGMTGHLLRSLGMTASVSSRAQSRDLHLPSSRAKSRDLHLHRSRG